MSSSYLLTTTVTECVTMSDEPAIRAGDTVRHIPTGELWYVVAVNGEWLQPAGWPPCSARVADCEVETSVGQPWHINGRSGSGAK